MKKGEIENYLACLNEKLAEKSLVGEIVLFGGAAMVLAHQARVSTKDVDAVFAPKTEIYEAAASISREQGAPEGWLNDAVKGFLAQTSDSQLLLDWPNLKVYAATPEYLLAMKCMSMRLGQDETDLQDILFLMKKLGLSSAAEILDLVESYYPAKLIQPKTRFAIEELCQSHHER